MDAEFSPELVAPCGFNCALCPASNHGAPKVQGKVPPCAGCRSQARTCYLQRSCPMLRKGYFQSCSQCMQMPCKNLLYLDERYRKRYGVSLIENLKEIQAHGIEAFLESQRNRYRCPKCGGVVCVGDKICGSCGYVEPKKP